jgi:outer membrane lipoprotein-sorting protein
MKKSILFLTAILMTAFLGTNAQTLGEVLDKHFKANGQEKLVAVKTYSIKAKISQMGTEMPLEMKMKRPDKFRMEMDIQGQKMIQAFDGEKGWVIAPWVSPEPQELSGDQLKQAMEQANIDGELYNYEKNGLTVELTGKVKDGDSNAYLVKVTNDKGDVKSYFIDTEKYLINKVKAKVNAMGQTVEVEQRFAEYKNIDGIMIATKIESVSPMGTATISMDEVKFNVEIDDAIFNKPAK